MRYSTTADWIEAKLPSPIRRKKQQIEYHSQKLWSRFLFFLSSKRVYLIRFGIPALVLLMTFPIGYLSARLAERGTIQIAGLIIIICSPIGLIIAQKTMTRFEWSSVFILAAAIYSPIELPTGTASVIVDSLLIALIFTGNWVLQMIIVEKRFALDESPLNAPFWGFVIISFFSLVWSNFFSDPLVEFKGRFLVVQLGSVIVNIMLIVTLFLVTHHINHIRQLKIMVILMLVGGFLGYMSRFGGLKIAIDKSGQMVNDGGFFTMWVTALGVAICIFNTKLAWKWRIIALSIGLALQMGRFLQNMAWLAGWLPGFIMLAVLLVKRSKLLLIVGIVIAGLFIVINITALNEALEAESAESGETRLHAWQTNWRITGKHVVFGTGQAAYVNYYVSYFSDEGFQIQATHNTILDILAQNGMFGLFFVFWFLYTLLLLNYKITLRFEGQGDFAEALANACFAGTVASIISMAFGDWLFPFAYTNTISGYDYIVYTWLFMGTGLALDKIIPPNGKPPVVARKTISVETNNSINRTPSLI